jgi:hypothetical protein
MNYLNGGDGSSGIPGTESHPELWQMSLAEVAPRRDGGSPLGFAETGEGRFLPRCG